MKGICFIEPLHYKVVDGLKEQTRRVMSPQPIEDIFSDVNGLFETEISHQHIEYKPRYKLGEILYLKEPYSVASHGVIYRYEPTNLSEYAKAHTAWKNKLFMPEKYARHHIEITGVRAERLQDISDEDCLKEGISLECIADDYWHYHDYERRYYCADCEEIGRKRLIKEALKSRELFGFDNKDISNKWIKEELDAYCCDDYSLNARTCDVCGKDLSVFRNISGVNFYDAASAYADLIDKISGKGTWESNPFVWVYDFKIISK